MNRYYSLAQGRNGEPRQLLQGVTPRGCSQMIPLEDHPNSNIKVPLYQLLQAPLVLLSTPPIPAEAWGWLSRVIMLLYCGRQPGVESKNPGSIWLFRGELCNLGHTV